MTHNGRCLCARYRFEATGAPLWVAHCHCESCRRCTGAPVATYAGFHHSRVSFNLQPPGYESSSGVMRSACERCGTPLSYQAERWPGEIHLFRSTFATPADFAPTRHVYFDEREPDFEVWDDLPRFVTGSRTPATWGPKPALRILYLCAGNSARSILAEAITNIRGGRRGEARIIGHSAGSHPAGEVNDRALALLSGYRHLLDDVRSKSWDEFQGPAAPPIDLVVTLCDAATVDCPAFPGAAERRHWGLPDPAAGEASFEDTYTRLEVLIEDLCREIS